MNSPELQTPKLAPPDILTLTALAPSEQNGVLHSTKLAGKVVEYSYDEGLMWDTFEEQTDGGVPEEREGRRLAEYYLLKTALKAQQPYSDAALWAERFSEASDELYGEQELDQLQTIATQEDSLAFAPESSLFRQVYEQAKARPRGSESSVSATEQFNEIQEVMQQALLEKFAPIVEVISALPNKKFTPTEVRDIFTEVLQKLQLADPSWADWKVTNPQNKTMLSVVASDKEIEVPDGRSDISGKVELLSLTLHEIGVHAQRAVNGRKIDPGQLDKGLSGYADFEEGLGVLFEVLANGGIVPDKLMDRYMDIALVKGLLDGRVYTRQEISQIGYERAVARYIKAHGTVDGFDTKEFEKESKSHVNRIFRGGTGELLHNAKGEPVQAVYSKDLVYYVGYIKALAYVNEQIKSGVPATDILDYLLLGKFDATNQEHVDYVKSKTQK